MTTKITEQNISNLANAGVNWQPVVTADGSTGLTAVAGRGYFIDTTSGAQTVTLPASPKVGDVVVLKDYARTWATNNVTIASTLIDGGTNTATFSTSGQTITLVRMDNTKGWSIVNEDTTTNLFPSVFTAATGGTVTESGDFKIHTFTGDGCFVVSQLGNASINPTGGPSTVDYLVVAGGGGGGGGIGGGGGAGGFREGKSSPAPSYTASPLAAAGISVLAQTYPVTVGAGGIGTGGGGGINFPGPSVPGQPVSTPGNPSTALGITSTGGGYGRHYASQPSPTQSGPGGSGGGGSGNIGGTGGTGNTPPVSPSQGNNGGDGNPSMPVQAGGGGGATAVGSNFIPGGSGPGGAGATTSISGSPTAYAGGGGGGGSNYGSPTGGTGGTGGGGNGQPGSPPSAGQNGNTNTGGGGGGGAQHSCQQSGYNGGSGIVIIRYKFQ